MQTCNLPLQLINLIIFIGKSFILKRINLYFEILDLTTHSFYTLIPIRVSQLLMYFRLNLVYLSKGFQLVGFVLYLFLYLL